jgi:phenylpyruvate tautomerase PptA (4-oxalocrotonate tautomerase family)
VANPQQLTLTIHSGPSDNLRMPYLQLDLPRSYPAEVKRQLARRLGDLYAELMQTTPGMVNVGFRELGEGNLYRCGEGEPEPAAVVQCDIRQGRPSEQRLELAKQVTALCAETLGLRADRVAVEFTQHTAQEMYRNGSWGQEWSADEAANGQATPTPAEA